MTALKHSETDSAIRRDRLEDRSASSFLVRVWYEAREEDAGRPAFRGYVRNLRTGVERFLRDPGVVGEEILRQLDREDSGPRERRGLV